MLSSGQCLKRVFNVISPTFISSKESKCFVELPRNSDLIFMNKNYAVFNKPPMVVSQPPDLRTWYKSHDYDPIIFLDLLKEQESAIPSEVLHDIRIIHRIDTNVSGGMVLALNKIAAQMFSRNLQRGGNVGYTITRKYVAKVGSPKAYANLKQGLVMQKGAISYFKRVDSEHVVVQLVTGKKHQIRKLLSTILKTPVYNDTKYKGEKIFDQAFQIALHSSYIKTKIGLQLHEHIIPVPRGFTMLWGDSVNSNGVLKDSIVNVLREDWSEDIKNALIKVKETKSESTQLPVVL